MDLCECRDLFRINDSGIEYIYSIFGLVFALFVLLTAGSAHLEFIVILEENDLISKWYHSYSYIILISINAAQYMPRRTFSINADTMEPTGFFLLTVLNFLPAQRLRFSLANEKFVLS